MRFKNSLKFFFVLFSVFVCTLKSNGQSINKSLKSIWENSKNPDSTRFNAINTFYKSESHVHPDSLFSLTDFHYNLAKKKNSYVEMANALNEKAFVYYIKGDTKKSMVELKKVITIYEKLKDSINLSTIYGNVGNIYGEERKYQEAVRYFNKTLEIYQKTGNKKDEARMNHNLGLIYYLLDNEKLALDSYTKSLNIYDKLGLQIKKGEILSDIGAIYFKQKKYKDAVNKGEEALKILLKNNDQFSASDCYFMMAKAYKGLNDKEKTNYYLEKSLEVHKEIKNNSKIIERLTFKADLLVNTDVNLATKKAEEVLKLVNKDTENQLKVDLYDVLYKCYKSQNKLDLSLAMHEKYVVYSDSLKLEKNNLSIIEEAIQNEYKEKINENKSFFLKSTFIIIAISTVLVVFIFLYTRIKIKKNRKKRDELLEEIEKLKKSSAIITADATEIFELSRVNIEKSVKRKLNETDWSVLNVLLQNPVSSNKEIASQVFMSVDGIGSSLRRMYDYFEIGESKYKKTDLIRKAIQFSNNS